MSFLPVSMLRSSWVVLTPFAMRMKGLRRNDDSHRAKSWYQKNKSNNCLKELINES
jgi:hypothetical protein